MSIAFVLHYASWVIIQGGGKERCQENLVKASDNSKHLFLIEYCVIHKIYMSAFETVYVDLSFAESTGNVYILKRHCAKANAIEL